MRAYIHTAAQNMLTHVLTRFICVGSMNKRETLMSAALFRTVLGDFATAANLLETIMLDHANDVISMKYAQQAYYLLG